MQLLKRYLLLTMLVLGFTLLTGQTVQAHLMVAQHGTLNITNDGVFMVLSLPISAFDGIDDNKDGAVSMLEFNNHRAAIIESIHANVALSDSEGSLLLAGIMLSPVAPHDAVDEALSQLVVMGRYSLNDLASGLRFHVGLYGRSEAERALEITATHKRDSKRSVFELTPATPAQVILAGSILPRQGSFVWDL